ncbi:PREDICTED: uncharacterized protein LOC104728742 [Camelina sativa]|uniref:Uncharacterized protein LOC104728742 n=1 Tax=Camelina sativa TaxID=90675 RepID=A0ABM0UTA5_CAMSA|nr:PREDICTED: uncharacterized protein LOC104728742 [Camelina sativa]
MDLLHEHFDLMDVDLIGALPLGSCPSADSLGWHFTKSGKYTVKSGYHTARRAAPRTFQVLGCGPEITPILASVWQVKCPPKIQHFMRQVLSGCLSVSFNLRRWGIACDLGCSRCGADDETINHAIFVCPSARQVWALSHVPVGPISFPTDSLYANMDHFLGSKNPVSQASDFPWVMWYIWKARNAWVFENKDEQPGEIFRVAKGEALSWQQEQEEGQSEDLPSDPVVSNPRVRVAAAPLSTLYSGHWCFVDGSWKAGDTFAGAGWLCTASQDSSHIMGATNFR